MEQKTSLELVRSLCESLNAGGIVYCHWKSNANLDRSASGENDLDLLISRSSVQQFTEILYQQGFKRAFDTLDRQMPGVLDYYGYDQPSDKFVHVHAHYQLVLGHDGTKNYHLPVETQYLASSVEGDLFKTPAPEFELILLVIRMMIKHATWDVIFSRQGKLSDAERGELQYLQERISQARLNEILEIHFPWLGISLFNECRQSLEKSSSFWGRARAGWKLQRLLTAHTRRSQGLDVWLKTWRRFKRGIQSRVNPGPLKKHMSSGGLLIAIVGGDGSGKTTVINNLHEWLSDEFDVIKVHMGKPAWSWTTIAVRGILKFGNLLGLYPFTKVDDEYALYTDPPTFPGYPWLIREVCTSRDRYLTYAKVRRFASNGGIVICDRFPLPQVKLMDGPQVERMASILETNWFIKLLAKIEKRYYLPVMLPDLLIVLRADPEISVLRKTDEQSSTVRARAGEIWGVDWQQTSAHVVDASRSKEEVLSDIKTLVWSRL